MRGLSGLDLVDGVRGAYLYGEPNVATDAFAEGANEAAQYAKAYCQGIASATASGAIADALFDASVNGITLENATGVIFGIAGLRAVAGAAADAV